MRISPVECPAGKTNTIKLALVPICPSLCSQSSRWECWRARLPTVICGRECVCHPEWGSSRLPDLQRDCSVRRGVQQSFMLHLQCPRSGSPEGRAVIKKSQESCRMNIKSRCGTTRHTALMSHLANRGPLRQVSLLPVCFLSLSASSTVVSN